MPDGSAVSCTGETAGAHINLQGPFAQAKAKQGPADAAAAIQMNAQNQEVLQVRFKLTWFGIYLCSEVCIGKICECIAYKPSA